MGTLLGHMLITGLLLRKCNPLYHPCFSCPTRRRPVAYLSLFHSIVLVPAQWTAAGTAEQKNVRLLYHRRSQWTDWASPLGALELDGSLTWTAAHVVKPEFCRSTAPLCLGGTFLLLGDSSGALHAWTPHQDVIWQAAPRGNVRRDWRAVVAITTYATRNGSLVALVAHKDGSLDTVVFYKSAKQQAGGFQSAIQATQHSVEQQGTMEGRIQRMEASVSMHKNAAPGVVEVAVVTEEGNLRLGRLHGGDGNSPKVEWIAFDSLVEQGSKIVVASIQRAGLYMLTDSGETRWLSHGAAWTARQHRKGPPMPCQGKPATHVSIQSADYDAWGHRAVALSEEGDVAVVKGILRPGARCSTFVSSSLGLLHDQTVSSLTVLPGFGALSVTASGRLLVLNFTASKFGSGPSSHYVEATVLLEHDMIDIARAVPGLSDRKVYVEWKPGKGAWPLYSSSRQPKQSPNILLLAERADLDIFGGPLTPGSSSANGIVVVQLGPSVVGVFATTFPQHRGSTKPSFHRFPLGWAALLQPFFIAATVALAFRRAKAGHNKHSVANLSLDRTVAMPTLDLRRRRPAAIPSDEDLQSGEDEEDQDTVFTRWKEEGRYDDEGMMYGSRRYLPTDKFGRNRRNHRASDTHRTDRNKWARSIRPLVDRAPVLHRERRDSERAPSPEGGPLALNDRSRGGDMSVPAGGAFKLASSDNDPRAKNGEDSVTDVVWD